MTPRPSRWVHYGDLSRPGRHRAAIPARRHVTSCCGSSLRCPSASVAHLRKRDLCAVGRTHGIHAEPMTFGMGGSWATKGLARP